MNIRFDIIRKPLQPDGSPGLCVIRADSFNGDTCTHKEWAGAINTDGLTDADINTQIAQMIAQIAMKAL